MGNWVRVNDATPKEAWLHMSNGCTCAVLDVIGLSGSRLARTEDEKELIVWLLEKDQSCCGRGAVDFDLCEMPWQKKLFDKQKAFMSQVVEGIYQKLGWETLDYTPNETIVFGFIEKLNALIGDMTIDDVDEQQREQWLVATNDEEPLSCGFPYCEKHHVLLTLFGCHVCNN